VAVCQWCRKPIRTTAGTGLQLLNRSRHAKAHTSNHNRRVTKSDLRSLSSFKTAKINQSWQSVWYVQRCSVPQPCLSTRPLPNWARIRQLARLSDGLLCLFVRNTVRHCNEASDSKRNISSFDLFFKTRNKTGRFDIMLSQYFCCRCLVFSFSSDSKLQ
jgi:hypothetical protein